jgi:hypothetical protein
MAANLDKLISARKAAEADGNAEAVAEIDKRIYAAQMKGVDQRSYQDRLLSAASRARADGNTEALAKIHEKLGEENARLVESARQAEADKLGPVDRGLASFSGGTTHALRQVENLATNGRLVGASDEEVRDESKDLNRLTKGHALSGGVPRTIGGMLPALATVRPGPQTFGALVRGGAVQGGVFSDPGDRVQSALTGGSTALGLGAAGKAINWLGRPITPEGAGKVLVDQGYGSEMTAGQYQPGKFLNRLEHATANVPIAGPIMRRAYDKSLGILDNRIEAEMAPNLGQVTGRTSPISGQPIPGGDTHKFLKTALDRLDNEYESIRKLAPGQGTGLIQWAPQNSITLADNITQAIPMTDAASANAKKLINGALSPMHNGAPSWNLMHQARSNVRDLMRKIGPNADLDGQSVKAALVEADKHLSGELAGYLPPDAAARLTATDKSWNYGHMVADASAAGSGLKTSKNFQPNALAQAKEARLGTMGTATGAGGPQREFIEAADSALTPPPSAEAARAIQAAGGGPFALAALRKRALGVVGGLSGAYTPWGQNFLKGETFWQPALRAAQGGVPDETQALIRLLAVQKENE